MSRAVLAAVAVDLPRFGPVIPLVPLTAAERAKVRAHAAKGARALGLRESSTPPRRSYRVFTVGRDAEGPVLTSPYVVTAGEEGQKVLREGAPDTWRAGELETHCIAPRPCRAPRIACRCGVYAFLDLRCVMFMGASVIAVTEAGGRCVVGLHWGFQGELPGSGLTRFIVRELRAERLRLRHLFTDQEVDEAAVAGLAARYSVQVTPYTEALDGAVRARDLARALTGAGYGSPEVDALALEAAAAAAGSQAQADAAQGA